MAYKYEHEVISELEYMGVEHQSNGHFEMANEVEEVYHKAKAFDEIKETFIRIYVTQNKIKEPTASIKVKHQIYRNILRKMEELDGTNEFSNLLSDIQDFE